MLARLLSSSRLLLLRTTPIPTTIPSPHLRLSLRQTPTLHSRYLTTASSSPSPPSPPSRPPSRPTTTTTTSPSPSPSPTSVSTPLPIDSLPRYPALSTPGGLLRLLDYVGTLSFAHTGALLAASSGMDLLGTTLVATVTAVGGGTIRDAVILNLPPFWTEEPEYLYLCLLVSIATFALWPRDKQDDSVLHFATDALGVAAFAVIGAQNGVRARMPPVVSLICGVATATFGGAVRDLLCNRKVRILHSHAEVYATTAGAGAAAYLAARSLGAHQAARVGAGLAVAFAGRTYAWLYGTRLPVWHDDKDKDKEEEQG